MDVVEEKCGEERPGNCSLFLAAGFAIGQTITSAALAPRRRRLMR